MKDGISAAADTESPKFTRLDWFAGIAIFLVSLLHVPAVFPSLNYFDPLKRFGWCIFFGVVLIAARRVSSIAISRPVLLLWWMTVGWLIIRTMLRDYPSAGLDGLTVWLLPFVAFLIGVQMGQARSPGRWLGWLLIAGAAQALLMLAQYTGHDPLFSSVTSIVEYRPGRMIGTIGYHNQAADFVALAIPALFLLPIKPGLRLFAAIFLLGVIALTGSRGAIAGSILAFALLLFTQQRIHEKRMTWGAITLVVLISVILVVPTTRQRIFEVFIRGVEAPAIASRLWLQHVAWSMWDERPLTGWGAGAYAFQYTERLGVILPGQKTHAILRNLVHAREPHHDLLQFGAELGLVGVVLLAGLIAAIVVRLWRQRSSSAAAGAGLFVLAYMAIASSVSFSWQTAMAGPLAGLWLGWCMAVAHVRDRKIEAGSTAKSIGWPVSVCVSFMLVWFGWNTLLSTRIPQLIQRGEAEKAVAEAWPWGYQYLSLAGASLAEQKKYDAALLVLEQARRGFCDALLLNNLGHVYVSLGELARAQEVYGIWARSGIEHRMALDNYSVVLERMGDYGHAADVLEQKLMLWRDKDPVALGRLATLHHRAGNYGKVLWVVEQLRPRMNVYVGELQPETLNLAGATLIQLQQPAEAFFWLDLALEKNPGLISARKNLESLETRGVSRPE